MTCGVDSAGIADCAPFILISNGLIPRVIIGTDLS
jgi:hypothetical protein